jgi:phospholipid/cholesterol/gamma-HCH transport system ATP-binding protein
MRDMSTAVQPSMIRVENLSAAYDGRTILENVSFTVDKGEVFVILGGSGCGKSTLLKHMIGLYEPTGGCVFLDGDNLTAAVGVERKRILRKIGVMYQSGALFGSLSLIDNVRLPLVEFTRLSAEAIELIARMKLHLVGLSGFELLMPAELSGGMQKRAAIARAMSLDPGMLFLDEPSAGLDPITAASLDQLIVQLARTLHITFVVVTHELASIFAIADRVVMLDKETRGIIASGAPLDLREHSRDPKVRQFLNRQPA